MKYVLDEKDAYREYRGYVFAHGNPVTINDRGTLEAIKGESAFKEYKDEPQKVETPAKTPVLAPIIAMKRGPGRPRKAR